LRTSKGLSLWFDIKGIDKVEFEEMGTCLYKSEFNKSLQQNEKEQT
jgi:hypothetical protein